MNSFILKCDTEIVFGSIGLTFISDMVRKKGKRILLVTGNGSVKMNSEYQKLYDLLSAENCIISELDGINGNPDICRVKEGIELINENRIEWILAIGGGSVIDTAKAIGSGLQGQTIDEVWSAFVNNNHCFKIPLVCIPSMIGSGAEISRGCVISNQDTKEKISKNHDFFRPDYTVVIPEMWNTCRTEDIMYGCTDIISHIFERYFFDSLENDLSDNMCVSLITSVLKSMSQLKNNRSLELLGKLEYASLLAQCGFLYCGRYSDGFCHSVEHCLSGIKGGISHTKGIAALTLPWLRAVKKVKSGKIEMLYDAMYDDRLCLDKAERFIHNLGEIYKDCGIQTRLVIHNKSQLIDEVAERVTNGGRESIGKYVPFSIDDIRIILDMAMVDGGIYEAGA